MDVCRAAAIWLSVHTYPPHKPWHWLQNRNGDAVTPAAFDVLHQLPGSRCRKALLQLCAGPHPMPDGGDSWRKQGLSKLLDRTDRTCCEAEGSPEHSQGPTVTWLRKGDGRWTRQCRSYTMLTQLFGQATTWSHELGPHCQNVHGAANAARNAVLALRLLIEIKC